MGTISKLILVHNFPARDALFCIGEKELACTKDINEASDYGSRKFFFNRKDIRNRFIEKFNILDTENVGYTRVILIAGIINGMA
jgi:hypothetical protein